MHFVIDRRFKTSVKRTPRVLEIAEAFGLGLSEKEFVIYNRLALEINQGDVIYITGQSGSGKSLLLRDLKSKMQENGLKVADIEQDVLLDVPVIDQIPALTTTQAANILSLAGISDAWIYIRKPQELSDGQRYRLKLAMLLSRDDVDVWVADEFGAVLDRTTAKAIAFNTQKIARALKKTLLVATTHTDLQEELGPSLTITKRFRERINIKQAA